jgi:hypothetical protein
MREPDVRVFLLPSSYWVLIWNGILCGVSLACLVVYLVRFGYRARHRFRKKYWNIWWDRWLVLNLFVLVLIQAASWVSLLNALDPNVVALGNSLAALANREANSYVALFDNVSYDEKLADLLLGVCTI